jgi:hypothetical protein
MSFTPELMALKKQKQGSFDFLAMIPVPPALLVNGEFAIC